MYLHHSAQIMYFRSLFNIRRMTSSTTLSHDNPEFIRAAKKKLRREVKASLKSLDPDEKRRQTSEITRQILEDSLYQSARSISIYLNMEDEVGTLEILKNSLKSYKKCYIPQYFTQPEPLMNMVEIYDMNDFESLPTTKWKIKQPPPTETHREIAREVDLVIVPGLAFTSSGKRLGRGMGFYDRFLNGCSKRPGTIALAFDVQVIEDLPTDEDLDFMVDKVLFCRS